MGKEVAVLVTHGMGSQSATFGEGLIAAVNRRLKRIDVDPQKVAWKAAHWATVTEEPQIEYIRRARATGAWEWERTRDFVVRALGDASSYRAERSIYDAIHLRIDDAIRKLYKDLNERPKPLIVLAHSLGGYIVSNYIWDAHCQNDYVSPGASRSNGAAPFLRMEWLTGFITFGCNIPLFTFGHDKLDPISVPYTDRKGQPTPQHSWLNFYDTDDVLGYPLKPINDAYSELVDDRPIEVGRWSATPMSHTGYWEDKDFVRPVADYLAELLR